MCQKHFYERSKLLYFTYLVVSRSIAVYPITLLLLTPLAISHQGYRKSDRVGTTGDVPYLEVRHTHIQHLGIDLSPSYFTDLDWVDSRCVLVEGLPGCPLKMVSLLVSIAK